MKSMTGYGSSEGVVGNGRLFIEIKSVNHRYCDIQLKIPPKLNSVDPAIRKLIKNNVERGKVELFMRERGNIAPVKNVKADLELSKRYQRCVEAIEKSLGRSKGSTSLLEVVDIKDLISAEDVSMDYMKYWGKIKSLMMLALKKYDGMKLSEGRYLLQDQKVRIKKIGSVAKAISNRSDVCVKKSKKEFESKLKKSIENSNIARERLEAELASMVDKMDIAEELTRLQSHLSQYRHILTKTGAIGRQLDFLIQEMNREINTVGSKAGDAKISTYVVDIKSELEKLREQVQNIE